MIRFFFDLFEPWRGNGCRGDKVKATVALIALLVVASWLWSCISPGR
jgi:hypothetical protein